MAPETELGGHGSHLTGVVRLQSTDRHQGVRTLREHVRDDVLELAYLVAAERKTAVAVIAFGPHLCAREKSGESVETVDRAGSESEGVTLEVVDRHFVSFSE